MISGGCGELSIEFKVGIEYDLVIHFGFGEQNGMLMKLLTPFFGVVAPYFLRFFVLLRFEANLGAALFGSEL